MRDRRATKIHEECEDEEGRGFPFPKIFLARLGSKGRHNA